MLQIDNASQKPAHREFSVVARIESVLLNYATCQQKFITNYEHIFPAAGRLREPPASTHNWLIFESLQPFNRD
jgi:hypothetical protein